MIKGLAVLCDRDFNIDKVIRDDFKIIQSGTQNISLFKLIDKSSLTKAFNFKREINEHKAAFNWEINLQLEAKIDSCYLTGVFDSNDILIIATHQAHNFQQIYQEYREIFNEQMNLLRGVSRTTANPKGVVDQSDILNEFTRINNEFTDLQRELSQKNVKMAKQQKQLELINRILRHDLANDLAVIKSAVNMYQRNQDDTYLNEIGKYVMRGISLIRNMKQLESVFNEKKDLKPVDLGKLTSRLITRYKNIKFEFEPFHCLVMADEGLESVIDNIIRNAIRHGKTEKIDITYQQAENELEFKIADFGKGIPDTIKDKIFSENFTFGETGNTGLGLFIVKQMMQNYEGSVKVEDNHPKGVIFVLNFKLYKNSQN